MAYNLMDLRRRIIASQPHELKKSGSIVTFGTNLVRPMLVTARITPVQDLSGGEPSPSHICPITGWTGAEVTGAGVNLCDVSSMAIDYYSASAQRPMVKFAKPATYYINALKTGTTTNIYVNVKNADGTYESQVKVVNGTSVTERTVTITEGHTLMVYSTIQTLDDAKTSFTDWGITVSLESMSDYSAYSGTTLSVNWQTEAGTVYGGSLKVNKDGSGVLPATLAEVDLGSLDYTSYGNVYRASVSDIKRYTNGDDLTGKFYCSGLKTVLTAQGLPALNTGMPNNAIAKRSGDYDHIVVRYDDRGSQSLSTILSGIKLVYELATPVTYTLTSQQVGQLMSKLGQNNVWADTGDVEVEYLGY